MGGMAVSIALNTSLLCIVGDSNEKSFRGTTLNFPSYGTMPTLHDFEA